MKKNSRNKCLNSRQIFTSLSNLGECHSRVCKFKESLTFYNRALEIAQQEYGYYSVQVSSTLNCIGVTRFRSSMDKEILAEILALLTEALAINQAIFSSHQNHGQARRNATIMNNIGRVRFAREEYFEAMEMYEQAYKIRLAMFGEFHLDVAATLYNKGEVQELLGNLDSAISLYQKFLEIAIFKLGEGHHDIIIIYKKLAKIFHDRLEYAQATTMYLKALEVIGKCFGNDHPDVVFILNEIGDICYKQEDFNVAIRVFQEILNLQGNHSNASDKAYYYVLALINIADISHKQGNLDEALKFYNELLSIHRKSSQNQLDCLAIASTLLAIGLILGEKEQYLAASEVFEEALAIQMKELGSNHIQVSNTLNVRDESKRNHNLSC